MSEEDKKAIEVLKEDIDYRESDIAEYNETKYSNAERTIINLVNKQQKTIQEQNNFIEKLVKEHKEEIEKLKKNRDVQRELINDAVFDGYEKNYKSQLEDFTKEIDRLKNIIKSFESGEMVIGVKK